MCLSLSIAEIEKWVGRVYAHIMVGFPQHSEGASGEHTPQSTYSVSGGVYEPIPTLGPGLGLWGSPAAVESWAASDVVTCFPSVPVSTTLCTPSTWPPCG